MIPQAIQSNFRLKTEQEKERERLFGIIERLVIWENVNNKTVLDEAKAEIAKSTGGHPPAIYDPFCGGGSIPLEAQTVGTRSICERFESCCGLDHKSAYRNTSKVCQSSYLSTLKSRKRGMKGWSISWITLGLAEDVRYYGEWMRNQSIRANRAPISDS